MKDNKMKRDFRRNQKALVLVSIVAIVLVFAIAIIGLVGMLSANKIADAILPYMGSDIRASNLVQECRNALAISVVLSIVMVLIWWGVSAQRRESQEAPLPYYPR
jgi:uncharacterized BrkB/YihY/UPF0761 family membrane protein